MSSVTAVKRIRPSGGGGIEPYQYEPATESDSGGVSETQLKAGGTVVNGDIDQLQNMEW